MKRVVFLLLTILGFLDAFSQDKILDRSGTEHVVVVTEITPDSVFYRDTADTLNQKVNSLNKNSIFMITFKNGVKEVFPEKKPEKPVQLASPDYYLLGKQDAKKYYKGTGAFWGTFAITAVPFFGAAVAVYAGTAISLIPASKGNIKTPNPEYLQNPTYLEGYRKQARKKKFGRAASGFGLGLIPYSVLSIGLMAVMLSH